MIRLRRLQWAGYVQWMEDGRILKKILKRVYGTRPKGRPRQRWEDSVDADSGTLLDIRNWRTRVWTGTDGGNAYGKPRLDTG